MAVPVLLYPVRDKLVVEHHGHDQQGLIWNVFEVSAAHVDVEQSLFAPVIGDAVSRPGDPVRYNSIALAIRFQPIKVTNRLARSQSRDGAVFGVDSQEMPTDLGGEIFLQITAP